MIIYSLYVWIFFNSEVKNCTMIFYRNWRAKFLDWQPRTAVMRRSRLHPRRQPTPTRKKTLGRWHAAGTESVWPRNFTTSSSSVRSASKTFAIPSASNACIHSASSVLRTTSSPKPATRNIPTIVSTHPSPIFFTTPA